MELHDVACNSEAHSRAIPRGRDPCFGFFRGKEIVQTAALFPVAQAEYRLVSAALQGQH